MSPPRGTVETIQLLQGTLDLLILKTVALGPNHGWGIAERVREISCGGLNPSQGSLYSALHRLERNGHVAAATTELVVARTTSMLTDPSPPTPRDRYIACRTTLRVPHLSLRWLHLPDLRRLAPLDAQACPTLPPKTRGAALVSAEGRCNLERRVAQPRRVWGRFVLKEQGQVGRGRKGARGRTSEVDGAVRQLTNLQRPGGRSRA
jgi:hypothetical protein